MRKLEFKASEGGKKIYTIYQDTISNNHEGVELSVERIE